VINGVVLSILDNFTTWAVKWFLEVNVRSSLDPEILAILNIRKIRKHDPISSSSIHFVAPL
jgi:hypothetical protein